MSPGVGSSFGILTINGAATFNANSGSSALNIKISTTSNDVLVLSAGTTTGNNLTFNTSNGNKIILNVSSTDTSFIAGQNTSIPSPR